MSTITIKTDPFTESIFQTVLEALKEATQELELVWLHGGSTAKNRHAEKAREILERFETR